MTSKIGAKVQNESQGFVRQRSKVWDKYDEGRRQEKELNQYVGEFGKSNSSGTLRNLTGTNIPSDELTQAVWQLKQEFEKIKEAKSRIQSYQDEIGKTKKQFFIVVGISVIIIILVIMFFKR